jgi:hypothetical protein
MITLGAVDDADLGALLSEFFGGAKTDAVGTAGDHDDFVLEHKNTPFRNHYTLCNNALQGVILRGIIREKVR